MKLVHDGIGDIGRLAETQRLVCQDFSRAANDGSITVDRHIPGYHTHILTAQQVYEIKELLAHQRFYWSSVE